MTKVLVIGASGDQGIPLISALQANGAEVVAGTRRSDAMQNTPHNDVETLNVDITDQASLMAAFGQVDAVAAHLPFTHDVDLAQSFGRNIASAAGQAGLKKIVFNTSCFVADQDLGLGGHDGRRRIEQCLRDSGVDTVILRPVVFMDNAIRGWIKPAIVNRNLFVYPAKQSLKVSWLCLEDLGKLIAHATLSPDLNGQTLTVGGPEALTGHEVAERISQACGREIRFHSIEPEEFAENMSELVTGSRVVAPGSVYSGMGNFYRWYNDQPVSPLAIDPSSFSDQLPVALTPYGEWAEQQDWD